MTRCVTAPHSERSSSNNPGQLCDVFCDSQTVLMFRGASRLLNSLGGMCGVHRTVHFFAGADKAKAVLGWQPQHNFLADVDALVAAYKESGREQKDIDFSVDDQIIAAAGN